MKKFKSIKLILTGIPLLLVVSAFLYVAEIDFKPMTAHGYFFNTVISITIYDKVPKSVLDDLMDLCRDYDERFDKHNPAGEVYALNNASEVYALNNAEYNDESPVSTEVSPELLYMIEKAVAVSELTGGKYDVTLGTVSDLWDFTAESPVPPEKDEITDALIHTGYKNIIIDGNRIKLLNGVQIDLGSIAKGYTTDKIVEFLYANGIKNAIINLGGNVYIMGKTRKTGIQKPFAESNVISGMVKVSNKSVVASGVYERYFYYENELYHHILDTSTGFPLNNGLYSVTIISDNSIDGDILSTAVFTLGLKDGMKLIESMENTDAVFITADGEVISTCRVFR